MYPTIKVFYKTVPTRIVTPPVMDCEVTPPEGLQTDVKVARGILGWTDEKTSQNPFYDPWAGLWRPNPQGKPATPAWSRNAAHTLQVIDAMAEKGWAFATNRMIGSTDYWVHFRKGDQIGEATAPFPYAVCLAALRAVGDPV